MLKTTINQKLSVLKERAKSRKNELFVFLQKRQQKHKRKPPDSNVLKLTWNHCSAQFCATLQNFALYYINERKKSKKSGIKTKNRINYTLGSHRFKIKPVNS